MLSFQGFDSEGSERWSIEIWWKTKKKVDSDHLHVVDAHFVEPLEMLMIETTNGLEGEQAHILDSLVAFTINTTDGFENE